MQTSTSAAALQTAVITAEAEQLLDGVMLVWYAPPRHATRSLQEQVKSHDQLPKYMKLKRCHWNRRVATWVSAFVVARWMRHRHLTHITPVMSLITVQRAHRIQTEHLVMPRLMTCHLRSSDLKSSGRSNLRCLMCRTHESSDYGCGTLFAFVIVFCVPLFLCVCSCCRFVRFFGLLRFVFVVFCVFSGVRFCVSCFLIVFMFSFFFFSDF